MSKLHFPLSLLEPENAKPAKSLKSWYNFSFQKKSISYSSAATTPTTPNKAAPPRAFCEAAPLALEVEERLNPLCVLEDDAAASVPLATDELLVALATAVLSVFAVTPAATVALAGIPVMTPLESVMVV
jgi:hypothetical protein